jgi:CarD family transcriptional regulator
VFDIFKIGDKIFYPRHGAGTIEAIEEKEILGENRLYYILKIPHINVQIMVPKDKALNSGMRRVVDPDTMEYVLKNFYQGETDPNIYSNNRYCITINRNKIKSGDIYQGIEIIRDLMRKSRRSKLGIEDRNMLENARQIFLSELKQVKGLSTEEAEALLDEVLESEEVDLASSE